MGCSRVDNTQSTEAQGRPLRSDAERNRERVVIAQSRLFAERSAQLRGF